MLKKLCYVLSCSLFLWCCSTFAIAKKITTLVPDSIEGPVTQAEIEKFNAYYPTYKVPESNDNKKMSWNLAPYIHALLFMYEITHDIQYIEQAIKAGDSVLKAKRTTDIDYVTQRIIPGWGYFNKQFTKKGGHPVLYNNVVGNATVMRSITRLAFIIQENNLENKYQLKAQRYINSSIETINNFIENDDWFNHKHNLFRFPKHKRHDEVLYGTRGLELAHNRQLLMASAMLYVVQYQNKVEPTFINKEKYQLIINNTASFFWNSTKSHKLGNRTYLSWNYREQGKINKKNLKRKSPKIEDVGHGGFDIKALAHIFKQQNIGSVPHMQALASTLIDKAQVDQKHHKFSYGIDGSDANKDSKRQQRDSMRWLVLSEWDRRVYQNAGWLLTNNTPLVKSLPYAEFLYYKASFYGVEPKSVL